MDQPIPGASDVRSALERLGHADVQSLSRISGVPFTTLWKMRDGTTTNPGIETVRRFWGLIGTPGAPPVPTAAATAQEAG